MFFLVRGPCLDNANDIGARTQRGGRNGRIADSWRARDGIRPPCILLESHGRAEASTRPGGRQKFRGRVGVLEKKDRQGLRGVTQLLVPYLGAHETIGGVPSRIGGHNGEGRRAARTHPYQRIGGLLGHKGLLRRCLNQIGVARGQIPRIL